ncbi:MAG: Crp/Fnr family transcriptional regulator [Bacteroidia bacterium]|nr:Crp/Fnr family transcriptional regulator [Bacteroidia bacterium]
MQHIPLLQRAFQPLDLNPASHPEFFKGWEEVQFKRSDFITESGVRERHFYVVVSGVQAIYIIGNNGDKKVIGFSFDGSFSGVYDSFLEESPSHYFLEALTPSTLIRTTLDDYNSWFTLYPEFNYWGRIVHQHLLIGRVKREIELITMTAKERFDAFIERCPAPLLTIPQKYLASYLNMTPETFSRLRSLKS